MRLTGLLCQTDGGNKAMIKYRDSMWSCQVLLGKDFVSFTLSTYIQRHYAGLQGVFRIVSWS